MNFDINNISIEDMINNTKQDGDKVVIYGVELDEFLNYIINNKKFKLISGFILNFDKFRNMNFTKYEESLMDLIKNIQNSKDFLIYMVEEQFDKIFERVFNPDFIQMKY